MADRVAATLTDFAPHVYKLLTLTVKSSTQPLAAQLDHLQASFRRLRQQAFWANRVKFGRAILELTMSPVTGLWHPHYHVVCRAAFLPQKLLSIAWARATNGSFIVDVRSIERPAQLANYLRKYLGKMSMLGERPIPAKQGEELYLALRHRKMIIPFGAPPPLPSAAEVMPEIVDPADWQFVGMLDCVIRKARDGDNPSIALLRLLERGPP